VGKLRRKLSSICTALFCADDLMKPHGSFWDVRRCCGMRTNPVRWCFDNPEGLKNGDLLSQRGPRVREPANSVRHGTAVLS
jgi:hypothetical protein